MSRSKNLFRSDAKLKNTFKHNQIEKLWVGKGQDRKKLLDGKYWNRELLVGNDEDQKSACWSLWDWDMVGVHRPRDAHKIQNRNIATESHGIWPHSYIATKPHIYIATKAPLCSGGARELCGCAMPSPHKKLINRATSYWIISSWTYF